MKKLIVSDEVRFGVMVIMGMVLSITVGVIIANQAAYDDARKIDNYNPFLLINLIILLPAIWYWSTMSRETFDRLVSQGKIKVERRIDSIKESYHDIRDRNGYGVFPNK